jgi:hypothetical protein
MNRPTSPRLPASKFPSLAVRRPITRPQTIATLRRIIRTLRAKNTQLAEKLLIDLGMNLTA